MQDKHARLVYDKILSTKAHMPEIWGQRRQCWLDPTILAGTNKENNIHPRPRCSPPHQVIASEPSLLICTYYTHSPTHLTALDIFYIPGFGRDNSDLSSKVRFQAHQMPTPPATSTTSKLVDGYSSWLSVGKPRWETVQGFITRDVTVVWAGAIMDHRYVGMSPLSFFVHPTWIPTHFNSFVTSILSWLSVYFSIYGGCHVTNWRNLVETIFLSSPYILVN